jgi:glutathione S-transferase
MNAFPLTALVLLSMVLVQIWMMSRVARQRRASGINAPTMVGDPALERAVRVHMNTVEQLAMFLPALLVCLAYCGDLVAASIGAVWVIGRIWYAIGYQEAASKREWGFGITFLALAGALLASGYGLLRAWF